MSEIILSPIPVAYKTSELFWPEFVEIGEAIYLKRDFAEEEKAILAKAKYKSSEEHLQNHLHILDCFYHSIPHINDENDSLTLTLWNEHEEFEFACTIGRRMAYCWRAKLEIDFPDRNFRVLWSRLDDPIVRFYQIRPGESPLSENLTEEHLEEMVSSGNMLILDTKNAKTRWTVA